VAKDQRDADTQTGPCIRVHSGILRDVTAMIARTAGRPIDDLLHRAAAAGWVRHGLAVASLSGSGVASA
jgi:hypothetical protein